MTTLDPTEVSDTNVARRDPNPTPEANLAFDPDQFDPDHGGTRGTGTKATRAIGAAAIIMMAWLLVFGLVLSPADVNQGESVRLLYIHVPTIWLAYLSFVVTALASAMYLFTKKHSLGWDRTAGASAEIGVAFVGLTLVVGAMWGRLTWGVFWQWDARLTTTALLFVTYIGYLAVRRLGGSHQQRAKRSAIVGLLSVLLIPLVHWSVVIWRSLHQTASVLDTDGNIDMDGLMLFTLLVGVVAFTCLYTWLVMHRSRAMAMEDMLDDTGLDVALHARRAEEIVASPPADAATTTDVNRTGTHSNNSGGAR